MVLARYPEWRRVFVERLLFVLSSDSEAKLAFQGKLSGYFRGELPHCKEILTTTLMALLDSSTIHATGEMPADECNTVMRVSYPWPGRTKEVLGISLNSGLFDDFKLAIPRGPGKPRHLLYFDLSATDKEARLAVVRRAPLNPRTG